MYANVFLLLRILFAITIALTMLSRIDAVTAQVIPKSLSEGGTEFAIKQRKNAWTVGVVGGLIDGTYMRFADELGKVLDDGDNLRILPVVSYGAASNLDDLLYLRGVDVAVTQSDVFEYFRTERKTPNLQHRVHYILRLPIAELHVLAKTDIRSLEDLRGKKVNFGPAGSGSSLTGTIVFQRLGVQVEQVLIDQQTALQKATIRRSCRSCARGWKASRVSSAEFHRILDFTLSRSRSRRHLQTTTLWVNSRRKDYPSLVPDGQTVDTIAVPAVLAVYNWPKGSDRYRRIERFTERLFTHWDKFLIPPRHPKWREVNLGGTVPGWTRHVIAEQMLERLYGASRSAQPDVKRDFQVFLDRVGTGAPESQADREALFRQFLQWREQQAGRTR